MLNQLRGEMLGGWGMLGNNKRAGKHPLAACTWEPGWTRGQPQRGCDNSAHLERVSVGPSILFCSLEAQERQVSLGEVNPCPACLCQGTVW